MKIRSLIFSAGLAGALLCVAVPSGASAVAPGAELWAMPYLAPSIYDQGNDVVAGADGTKVFVTGSTGGALLATRDYATVAYDVATKTELWPAKAYDGPGKGYDDANAVGLSPDGTRIFVTGESYGSSTTGTAYATIAYNASTGAQLWVKRYNGPVNGSDGAKALAVSDDGTKVFVTGQSYGGSTKSWDYATIAYDASTGAQLWAKRYNGSASGFDNARALAVSGDGSKLFVTGESGGVNTDDDFVTVAYNASTGTQLWSKRYNGPGNDSDEARAVSVSPAGTKVFITGNSYGGATTENDATTIAYNASTGSQLWLRRFNGAASDRDYGEALVVSGDGAKVFVAGYSYAGSSNLNDYLAIAYNSSSGEKLWSTRYNGPGSEFDAAYAVGVNQAGTKVFVTGDSYGDATTGYDAATVAYNAATGSKLWATRYNGSGNDYDGFYDLAVGGGKVFVSGGGYTDALTGYDVVTAVYEG